MIGKRLEIEKYHDIRGTLTAINNIHFEIKRMFFISDVPKDAVRGNHFSKTSQFLYVVVKGSCKVELDNGFESECHVLHTGEGLLFKKNTWMALSEFKDDTILCVVADEEYRLSDYSEDYNELLRIVREKDV